MLKSLYFTSNFGLVGFRVKQGDVVNARLPGDKTLPGGGGIQAEWAQDTCPGNHDSIIGIAYQTHSPLPHT